MKRFAARELQDIMRRCFRLFQPMHACTRYLGVDPSVSGCQSYEATDFLLYARTFDRHSALLLWQIGTIGEFRHFERFAVWNPRGIEILAEVLQRAYPADHIVTVYEAPRYACHQPQVEGIALCALPQARITPLSTLYVPPYGKAEMDMEMARRLSIYAPGSEGRPLTSAPPAKAPAPASSATA